MKTIGLLGGMSWESTANYYKVINQQVKQELGGLHSAKIVLYSVDFNQIEQLQHQDDWQATADLLSDAAQALQRAGAQSIVICTNTMHKVEPDIAKTLSIPTLHIADATAQKLIEDNCSRVGLLGTRFTMEQDFYKGRLAEKFGLEVLVPEPDDQQIIHDIIYNELCVGQIKTESRDKYLTIIDKLAAQGVEAVILGCTEIALLVNQQDTNMPLYDTTDIHAKYSVSWALA